MHGNEAISTLSLPGAETYTQGTSAEGDTYGNQTSHVTQVIPTEANSRPPSNHAMNAEPKFTLRRGIDYAKLAEKHPLKVIDVEILAPSLKHKIDHADDHNMPLRNQDSKIKYHKKIDCHIESI